MVVQSVKDIHKFQRWIYISWKLWTHGFHSNRLNLGNDQNISERNYVIEFTYGWYTTPSFSLPKIGLPSASCILGSLSDRRGGRRVNFHHLNWNNKKVTQEVMKRREIWKFLNRSKKIFTFRKTMTVLCNSNISEL